MKHTLFIQWSTPPPPLKIYFKKINIFKNVKNELNKRNEKKFI